MALQNGDYANFKVYTGLKKDDYYNLLADSKVLFNCALQDWVSNTVSEADTFGTLTLYPAYRSFPETFSNCPDRLYIPWSKKDAISKMKKLIDQPHVDQGKVSDWTNGTIDRMIEIMSKDYRANKWLRSGKDYRDYASEGKY